MSGLLYEVTLNGGRPWGIRIQGGKDFGTPLNVSRVEPQSKASLQRVIVGHIIVRINGVETDALTHMQAQDAIKKSGQQLQLTLKLGDPVQLARSFSGGSCKSSSPTSPTGPKISNEEMMKKKREEMEKRNAEEAAKKEKMVPTVQDSQVMRMFMATQKQK